MKVVSKGIVCTAKPEPREWNMNGRQGVTYRVEVSDGNASILMNCDSIDVYNKFSVFKQFDLVIELIQRTNDNGSYIVARIVEVGGV